MYLFVESIRKVLIAAYFILLRTNTTAFQVESHIDAKHEVLWKYLSWLRNSPLHCLQSSEVVMQLMNNDSKTYLGQWSCQTFLPRPVADAMKICEFPCQLFKFQDFEKFVKINFSTKEISNKYNKLRRIFINNVIQMK